MDNLIQVINVIIGIIPQVCNGLDSITVLTNPNFSLLDLFLGLAFLGISFDFFRNLMGIHNGKEEGENDEGEDEGEKDEGDKDD